jgi:RNA polymerase sigma factor (sigma-70 family)
MRSQQPCTDRVGDPWSRWREDYGSGVSRTIRAIVGSAHDAEEVEQEVWLTVYLRLSEGKPVPESPEAWLKALARRKAWDHHRKAGSEARRRLGRAKAGMLSTQTHPEAERKRAAIEKMIEATLAEIKSLEPSLRRVLERRLAEHLTVQEVADRLGVHINTVSNWQKKALQRLRPKLEALREELESLGVDFLPSRRVTPGKTSGSS